MAKNLGKSIKYLTFADDYKPKTSMNNCQMLSLTEVEKMRNILLISVLHIIGGGKSLRFRFQFFKENFNYYNMPVVSASGIFCMQTLMNPIP